VSYPARSNAQLKRYSGGENARNGEPTSFIVNGGYKADPEAAAGGIGTKNGRALIHPFNSDIWPILADKAQNFTSYSIVGLRFVYQATKGSAYNGQITCGFTKNTAFNSDFQTEPDNIINLPVSMRFQASDVQNTLEVPAAMMSQGGKNLFNPVNAAVANDEPTRYYAGTFMFCASDCADDTDIGRWHVEYDIRLEQSQLNTDPPSTECERDLNGDLQIMNGGRFNPVLVDANSLRVSSPRASVLVLYDTDPTVHVALVKLNGTTLVPIVVGNLCFYEIARLRYALLEFDAQVSGFVLYTGLLPMFVETPPSVRERLPNKLPYMTMTTTTTTQGPSKR